MHADDVAAKRKRTRRTVWIVGGAFTLLLALYFLPPVVDAYMDAKREGFFDEVKQKEYEGTSMENLRALHQAVLLYYESEGAMPIASGWMDAAKTYVRTADLKKGEELKKFVNPRLPEKEGSYGYAFNVLMSQVYLDEIEDPASLALIFESKETKWNAYGEPKALQPIPELAGGNKAVTPEGNAVTLRELLEMARD